MPENKNETGLAVKRVRIWYGALVLVMIIFGIRLFYVQVIRYSHYQAAALSDQLKQYQIPATRGLIEAQDGNSTLPIVLNQQLFTLYVDPTIVKQVSQAASKIQSIIGGTSGQYAQLMQTKDTRYVVLANKLTSDQSSRLLALKLPGVGTQSQDYRIYPDGSLASQVLGFVNNDGQGEYGLEQALNKQLEGTAGEVKAVTDANGVPLAASKGNIEKAPVDGDNIVTTINLPMQQSMEQILQQEYQKTKSQGISAIIMDPYTGQVKAMANYPTYDPSNYQNASNPSIFQNAAVSNPIEPG
jgi:cell division protein FtsI/penicillin-binding protein 2